ncbi:xylulokinase [Vallicoccus soli]|uniref:Xylulose kinase n=1 Tax=Vallicoccus soli TaxID=2339232 RepID=A0A3A3Z852_9ACTN|nr:xylulokinase [Vallicoccus soli]RJK97017.1 xylulokinase [Vallicoccus soli]
MPTDALVAGVDSSTQSCKVVVCEARTGRVVREGRAAHPDGSEVHPDAWWTALQEASGGGLLEGVSALAVGGQQHGMVALDGDGAVVRDALLWNDGRSAGAAEELVDELGGPGAWASAVGSVPVASFTVTKLRWLAEHEPERARRVEAVVLPHDHLTARLLGGGRVDLGRLATDRGDASGTGYWSPATGEYREDLLERALGRRTALPRVLGPAEAAGRTPDGVLVGAGTGDNMAAALGLGAEPGDVVVSLGTSGVVSAVHDAPTADAAGLVAGFADATGRFLPLVCTLNAARVLTATAAMLGTDLDGLSELALAAPPGAGGLVLLPYLDGERTPVLPDATGTLTGMTRANMQPANVARAAVEGMLCGLADGLEALRALGVQPRRVLLVGGAARSAAVQAVAPQVLGAPVTVPPPGEYVALGAARQAAWALAAQEGGAPEPPVWEPRGAVVRPLEDPATGAGVRSRYAEARHFVHSV